MSQGVRFRLESAVHSHPLVSEASLGVFSPAHVMAAR